MLEKKTKEAEQQLRIKQFKEEKKNKEARVDKEKLLLTCQRTLKTGSLDIWNLEIFF